MTTRFPWYISLYHHIAPEEMQVKLFFSDKLNEIAERIKHKKYYNSLEVGCAEGYISRWLLKHNYIKKATASDLRENALRIGKKRSIKENIGNRIKFKKFSIVKMPIKSKSFDLVLILDVLEHLNSIKDVESSLREARRICKKEIIVSLPQFNPKNLLTLFLIFEPDHLLCILRNKEILSVYSRQKFKSILEKLNFNYKCKSGKKGFTYYFISL